MPLTPAHVAAAWPLHALLNGLRGRFEGVAPSLGYAAVGGMVSLVVALIAFGIPEKPRTTEGS